MSRDGGMHSAECLLVVTTVWSLIFYACVCVCVHTQPQTSEWVHWNTMILEDTDNLDDSKKKIQDTLVSTLDTVRYKYIMDLCIKQNRLRSFLLYRTSVLLSRCWHARK